MRSGLLVLAPAALLLAACENDAASYEIGGSRDTALTLIREQRWFWSKQSEVALVVARMPECQRRHPLGPTPVGDARAELFQTGPETYLLQSGEGLYAIDLAACDAQAVEAPAQGIAGTPLGAFDRKDGRLRFIAAPPPG
jgi:hypothetical protein